MGGPQIIPGGIIEKPAPLPVSNVMVVCPTCKKGDPRGTIEGGQGQAGPGRGSARTPTASRRSTSNGRPTETYMPRLKEQYERRSAPHSRTSSA